MTGKLESEILSPEHIAHMKHRNMLFCLLSWMTLCGTVLACGAIIRPNMEFWLEIWCIVPTIAFSALAYINWKGAKNITTNHR